MKKLLLLPVFLFFAAYSFAQIKSPEEFLGYKMGSRFTTHHKLVSYFKYISEEAPSVVKLQQYGTTNEHRPLYLAFISSEKNVSNLENIRLNNLRLAHLAKDKMAPTEKTPAIVWLSYNVHGNEASSSEASMLTLFSLVNQKNKRINKWLQNTVVVIDPCLNPDGRERYVNWYNSIVGNHFNPMDMSREHNEPWPGGRSNHYNFDLNRDWAWQTQVESKQRVAQYNRWLPQIHVDFHEQRFNDPYYFAPAAKPYHEVITKWQSDFQKVIGKNIAKDFDKNGWLYFTKERFDLFYPSYGDTYPMYNGSIGMTYEQGGGGAGGLGVITNEGDTLTLYDRVIHHYTSGLSTIETASLNAPELLHHFHNFFNDAVNGKIGEYKTYVIKNKPEDEGSIKSLINLLQKNGIRYGTGTGKGNGYNYLTKKTETFTLSANDLLISASQPKAALVKALFEPQSKLMDSVTYDITAWALPYAYGLEAFATKQNIAVGRGKVIPDFVNNNAEDAYGYLIRWQGISSAKTVGTLLEKGIRMRFSETPFEINGEKFENGTVIITKKGNSQFGKLLWKMVTEICNNNQVKITAVETGMVDKGFDFGSGNVHPMKALKVAMLTGKGVSSTAAGEIWNFFDNILVYKLSLINAEDFDEINWANIEVLILPDGKYHFLKEEKASLQFHDWIKNGGRVIALERAAKQLSKQSWSVVDVKSDSTLEDTSTQNKYALVKPFANREREAVSKTTPGAIYKVNVDNTHPLMFGYPPYYYTLKMDTVIYQFIKEDGWNVGILKNDNRLSGYVGYQLIPKLKDGLLFGVQDLGKGTITYLADDILFRNFWVNGQLMFCNAVFMVGQ